MVCEGSVTQESDQIHNALFKAGMLCFRSRCFCWHNLNLNMKPKTLTTYVSFSTYAFLIDVGLLQRKNGATALTLDQMSAEKRSQSRPDSVFVSITSFPRDPLGSALLLLNRRLHNPALDSVQVPLEWNLKRV